MQWSAENEYLLPVWEDLKNWELQAGLLPLAEISVFFIKFLSLNS